MLFPYILFIVIFVLYIFSLAGTGHSHGSAQSSVSQEIGLVIVLLLPALCIFCVTRTEKYQQSKKKDENGK
jgi:NAD/NADP transhydrogenase beta subunit